MLTVEVLEDSKEDHNNCYWSHDKNLVLQSCNHLMEYAQEEVKDSSTIDLVDMFGEAHRVDFVESKAFHSHAQCCYSIHFPFLDLKEEFL